MSITEKERRISGFDLHLVSKYRSQLMGIAIIQIMFFHFLIAVQSGFKSGYYGNSYWIIHKLVSYYMNILHSIGVEWFVFLSGMGLYFSASKNEGEGLLSFYRRRYRRILIPYLVTAVVFWTLKDVMVLHAGFARFLMDASFLTFFTEGVKTIWYIALMIMLYSLFPLFYRLTSGKIRVIGFIAVMAITILFPVWVYSLNHELYSNIQIALTRFPIFVFGVFMGKEIKNGVRIPWLLVLDIIAIGFIAEYLLLFEFRGVNSYVARNVASIFSVSLLIILTLLCQLLGKCKWLMKILSTAGKYSLELYMAHVTVRNFTGTLGFDLRDPRIIFIMVVASLVWAAVIHIAAQGIYSLLDRKRPKTI